MLKAIKAKYRNGVFEPLEKVDLDEDSEVTVMLPEEKEICVDGLDESFGGWKGLIDAEEFIENIYEDRKIMSRPEVKL